MIHGAEPRLSYKSGKRGLPRFCHSSPTLIPQPPSPDSCLDTNPEPPPRQHSKIPPQGLFQGQRGLKKEFSHLQHKVFIFIELVRSQLTPISVSRRNPPLSQPEQPVPGKVMDASKESHWQHTSSTPQSRGDPSATNLPSAHPKPSSFLQNSTEQGLGGKGITNTTQKLGKSNTAAIEAIQF